MKEKGKEEGERTRGMRLAEEQCNRVVDQSPRHPPLKILRHLGRVATEIATWLALGIRNNNGSLLKPYPAYRPVKRVTRIAFFFENGGAIVSPFQRNIVQLVPTVAVEYFRTCLLATRLFVLLIDKLFLFYRSLLVC